MKPEMNPEMNSTAKPAMKPAMKKLLVGAALFLGLTVASVFLPTPYVVLGGWVAYAFYAGWLINSAPAGTLPPPATSYRGGYRGRGSRIIRADAEPHPFYVELERGINAGDSRIVRADAAIETASSPTSDNGGAANSAQPVQNTDQATQGKTRDEVLEIIGMFIADYIPNSGRISRDGQGMYTSENMSPNTGILGVGIGLDDNGRNCLDVYVENEQAQSRIPRVYKGVTVVTTVTGSIEAY